MIGRLIIKKESWNVLVSNVSALAMLERNYLECETSQD